MRKIRILCVGKNQEIYLKKGLEIYEKKLRRYCDFSFKLSRKPTTTPGPSNNGLIWKATNC